MLLQSVSSLPVSIALHLLPWVAAAVEIFKVVADSACRVYSLT